MMPGARRLTNHHIVTSIPDVADIRRRMDQLRAAQQKWQQRANEIAARRQAAEDERTAKLRDALLAGEDPPPPIDIDQFRIEGGEVFAPKFAELDAEYDAAIKTHLPEILNRISVAVGAVERRKSPLVDALLDLTDEANKLRRLWNEVTAGARTHAGSSTGVRAVQEVTLEQFIRGEEPGTEEPSEYAGFTRGTRT